MVLDREGVPGALLVGALGPGDRPEDEEGRGAGVEVLAYVVGELADLPERGRAACARRDGACARVAGRTRRTRRTNGGRGCCASCPWQRRRGWSLALGSCSGRAGGRWGTGARGSAACGSAVRCVRAAHRPHRGFRAAPRERRCWARAEASAGSAPRQPLRIPGRFAGAARRPSWWRPLDDCPRPRYRGRLHHQNPYDRQEVAARK